LFGYGGGQHCGHTGVDGITALRQYAESGFDFKVICRTYHLVCTAHRREHGVTDL
jgi:hypothetical protein